MYGYNHFWREFQQYYLVLEMMMVLLKMFKGLLFFPSLLSSFIIRNIVFLFRFFLGLKLSTFLNKSTNFGYLYCFHSPFYYLHYYHHLLYLLLIFILVI